MLPDDIKALTFDVFGTVVDWRGTIIREGVALNREKGWNVDWGRFADAWRGLYQPSLSKVRNGEIPWTKLDDLHRESLLAVLKRFRLRDLSPDEIEHMNRVWHRLDPWFDVVGGLYRLKRRFILATLSNGNVALIVNMAKRASLPWDVVLGAEIAGHYKPQPEAYLTAAELLGLAPEQCMMVAAHNGDLVAAAECGFRTAFVRRPREHGFNQTSDLEADHPFDFVAEHFSDLADQLGC